MVKIDELVILGLLVIIIYLYFKNHYKKEHFEVFFSPYYPISSQITVRNNNYENEIEDFRLETLKKVLKKVIFDANDGNTNYIQFNYSNRPIIKNLLTEDKIKPLTEFLLQSINSNLPEGHNLKVVDLKDMFKNEIENEVKVNFKMFCEYKIKVLNNYKYDIQKIIQTI